MVTVEVVVADDDGDGDEVVDGAADGDEVVDGVADGDGVTEVLTLLVTATDPVIVGDFDGDVDGV